MDRLRTIGIWLVVALVLAGVATVFSGWGTIDAGQRGVVLSMGAVTGEVKGEGLYFKTPWMDQIVPIDVRVRKLEAKTEAASKDLQAVETVVALNLNVDPKLCAQLYQEYGEGFAESFVQPALAESLKAVIAHYTAEELITRREEVRAGIAQLIDSKLRTKGLNTDAVNIVHFNFSPAFNHAIEAKVTAEQNALAAKNLLAQKQFEAQQVVATARGKAEAMQIESKALAENPQVLQLRALERWNGILPQVTGQVVPFIDLGQVAKR